MHHPLHAQVAIVTGGAKGYGLGITTALLEAGARVFMTGRDRATLDAEAARLGATALVADATSRTDWDRVIATVLEAAGRIDILVNNAGGGVLIAPAAEQTDDAIDDAIALNLTSAIYGCRRVAPLFIAQKSGIVVNISSIVAHHVWPGWGVYAAAKTGLNQFSKGLYQELRPHGARVTTITPSWGVTAFTDAAGLGPRDQETLDRCIKPSELGRLVADACALPAHLCIQETILWPTVQEVSPM